ncbi:MAG: hypothetical protein KBB21_12715 [Nannocystaceae bacterium]|nr:hypothetical protein [Nannocystaceae bacterium]
MTQQPRTPGARPKLRRRGVGLSFATALVLLASCRNNNTVVVPNRVLDRPLDVTLACVRRDGDAVEVLALNQCDGSGIGGCDDDGENQLIGFVTNSEKNEVGMFRRCDVNGMVDLDPESPGYNLVPVGTLPTRIAQTESCRVVTANVGSCDLSSIELPELARYAVGLQPETAPSSLVATLVPRRSDGTPLGASPGDLIAVPRGLSLAGDGAAVDPGGGDTGTSGGDVGGGAGACDPDAPASVFVTFPSCQLVAEISLDTQRVLQSRQFVTDADGNVTVVDAGPDPECPIECPLQFDDGLPDRPGVDPAGVFPVALALVQPNESDTALAEDSAVTFPTLFIGGSNSDEVFELELLQDAGTQAPLGFAPGDAVRRLRLEDPAGIGAIRPTPPMIIDGEIHQFLYVVAGDGSTHVVDRQLDGTSLGTECDTQVDPSQASSRACHPIDPGSQAGTAARRPFALGPGIRGPVGETITDWTFFRALDPDDPAERDRNPLGRAGVVGIGVTSLGRAVMGVFSQYDDASSTITTSSDGRVIDPIGLLNVEIRPHMLWPVTDPVSGDPSVFPLVSNAAPDRAAAASDQVTSVLAPSFRLIDRAYFANEANAAQANDFSDEQREIWTALGKPNNVDQMSRFDDGDEGFYDQNVARVAVRDYRQWRGGQTWALSWEPVIPGTESTTGRFECEDPSEYGGGTCHVGPKPSDGPSKEPEHYQLRLVDEGATFCDEGVLPGDKLVLFGCAADDDCGAGQRCLRDAASTGGAPGICVSSQAYAERLDDLRKACAPFITDPCGPPRREYLVTSASQTELTLGTMDIPPVTYARDTPCPAPTGELNLRPGSDGSDTTSLVCEVADDDAPFFECEARLSCVLPDGFEQPPGGCSDDSACDYLEADGSGADYICFDGLCRTPCEGGSFNCRLSVLPGPGCFAEFVRYSVAVRESLTVGLPDSSSEFLTDRVITDPTTGQCREDATVSTLLTSRIPIGANEANTFARIPDCPNADEASPTDPNPCRIVLDRALDERSHYHRMSFEGTPVEAIRYSNPYGSVVIDMVDLLGLASPNDLPGGGFSECFADFRRARIPRNYREQFTTPQITGYAAYNSPIVVGSTAMTYPVRVVNAPELGVAFAVDAGGRGGGTGVRGQVVRMVIGADSIRGDDDFRVR